MPDFCLGMTSAHDVSMTSDVASVTTSATTARSTSARMSAPQTPMEALDEAQRALHSVGQGHAAMTFMQVRAAQCVGRTFVWFPLNVPACVIVVA